MSPKTLKILAQLKLHLLEGDQLLAPRRQRRQKNATPNSEYENMRIYDAFLTPTELEEFETGVFTEEQMQVVASRENAFMDTLFDFNMWENPPQPADDVINLDDIQDNPADMNWDPEDLWV
jgi:hypothetical protein